MTALRQAAHQALEALDWMRLHLQRDHQCLHMDPAQSGIPAWINKAEITLRAALAEPERKPLTEEQVDRAYQEIWRDSPDDFGPTAGDWIEAGIRYAERVHGIIATEVNGDKDGSQG